MNTVLREISVLGNPHVLVVPHTRPRHHADAVPHPPTPLLSDQDARTEALQAASEEARHRGFEQGLREGFEQGVDEGRKKAATEARHAADQAAHAADSARTAEARGTAEHRERLAALVASITSQREQAIAEMEDDILSLAHDALCRILGEQASDAVALRAVVREALARRAGMVPTAVHVHPDDLALVSRADAHDTWRWIADPSIRLGGAVIRSAEGSLDARLEVQLASLGEALAEVRHRRRNAGQQA